MPLNRCSRLAAPEVKEKKMKAIRQAVVAAALSVGLVSVAEAHVFVGFGITAPVMPVVPVVTAVPVVPVPVYAPPPAYYAPPPPAYVPPVVVGYYGQPRWGYRHYGYGYAYWR
jgi:hypothetical protein